MLLDKKIASFLKKHHVLTLATSKDNIPWVAHCFYAFLEKEMCLVFTTDDSTRHGEEMRDNSSVSVGISWETKIVGQVRGAQISGFARKVEEPAPDMIQGQMSNVQGLPSSLDLRLSTKQAKAAYLKRFPYTVLMKTNLWVIEIESIKYTDNRLGFGKKLIWERGGGRFVTPNRDTKS